MSVPRRAFGLRERPHGHEVASAAFGRRTVRPFACWANARSLAPDPVAWRMHMLRGLCDLVDAQVGMGGEAGLPQPGQSPQILTPVEVGWPTASERAHWLRFCQELSVRPTSICRRWWAPPRGPVVTRTREQIVDRPSWRRSLDFNEYHKPCGLDESLISLHLLPRSGAVSGFSLHRELRRPPLGSRQCQLIQLFHTELGPLVGRSLATTSEPTFVDLSPRPSGKRSPSFFKATAKNKWPPDCPSATPRCTNT